MSYKKKVRDYLNANLSPRQHQQLEDLVDEGGFGALGVRFFRDGQKVQDNQNRMLRNAPKDRNNQKVAQRDARLGGGADNVDRYLADRMMDLEQAAPYALGAGALAAGAGLAGSALNAYSDQQEDYLPTDVLSVAGRMASNLGGGAAVGADPLADARNKVAEARKIVGSEAMLEALATDEIIQMRGEQEAAMTPLEIEHLGNVQTMIDNRARELMGTPIQKSDGSVMPMGFDTAQRIATEQVSMELRAHDIY